MRKRFIWQKILFTALPLLFVTCTFETDGNFTGLVAGVRNKNALRAPYNVKVTADDAGGIQITWDGTDDADGYTVYRSSVENPEFKRRGSTSATAYTDSGASVPPDMPFYYKVDAYRMNTNSVIEKSAYSLIAGPVQAKLNETVLDPPEISNAVVNGNAITVTWTAVQGAAGYILYRASSYDGGIYTVRTTAESLSFADINLMNGKYSYQVRAYNNTTEGYVSSPPWGPETVYIPGNDRPAPAKPQNLRAVLDAAAGTVAISWNTAANADSYVVYRSFDDELYEEIGNTTSTGYQDTTVENGRAYYYRVRGFNGTQEGYLSDSRGPVLIPPGKPEISAAVTDGTVTITWDALYGADRYYVYRSAGGSPFQLITGRGVTEMSYSDSGLAAGTYDYRVEASNAAGRGIASESSQVTIGAATPVITVHPAGGTYLPNVPANPLTVTARVNDGGTLTYQWYRNSDNANTGGTAISGAANAHYTPPTNTVGTVYYYVVVTNTKSSASGNITASIASNTARITVTDGSTAETGIIINLYGDEWDLIAQKANINIDTDQLFSVSGTYSAYQWYLDGTQAGTGSTYMFNQSAGVYELVIVAANSAGEKRSGRCRVTVSKMAAFTAANTGDFTAALTAIQANSTDSYFSITLSDDINLAPQSLTNAAYSYKSIQIMGNTADRKIMLSSQGSLFTVGEDVELVLENITLQGRSDNNTSLVKVNKDSKLVVNGGGKITGNTYTTATSANGTGGGGVFVDGGVLEIAGGEISENRVTYLNTSYFNNSIRGGGVYAANGSTVIMSGGTIKNNHINCTRVGYGDSSGGGIAIDNSSFEMISGIIEGNTLTDQVTIGDSHARGGGVHILKSSSSVMSSFYFKGGIIRNNTCNSSAPGNMGCAFGGGIFGAQGELVMSGGIISGNKCISSSNPNYYNDTWLAGAFGGGVSFWDDFNFTKTGGIIYGNEAVGNDTDGIPLKNTAQSNSSGLGGGYAVFYQRGTNSTDRRRNSTAYATNNMDSRQTGSAGGWE